MLPTITVAMRPYETALRALLESLLHGPDADDLARERRSYERYRVVSRTHGHGDPPPWDDTMYRPYTLRDVQADLTRLVRATRATMTTLRDRILHDLAAAEVPWLGSKLRLTPHFVTENALERPETSASVAVGRYASLTLFRDEDRLVVEDVLETGDRDNFDTSTQEADYFVLVGALRHPAPQRSRVLRLFTARPATDRARYDRATTLPSGIFLTTSYDEAEGYAREYGPRDVYELRIESRYLIQTLDTPRTRNYQTVAPQEGVVPVLEIARRTDTPLGAYRATRRRTGARDRAGRRCALGGRRCALGGRGPRS